MVFLGVMQSDREKLETEVIPATARLQFTRLARAKCKSGRADIEIVHINRFVNLSRTIVGKPIYVLEAYDVDMYEVCEFAWHFAELELSFRRPDSTELAQLLADFAQNDMLSLNEVNGIFQDGNVSFRLESDDEN